MATVKSKKTYHRNHQKQWQNQSHAAKSLPTPSGGSPVWMWPALGKGDPGHRCWRSEVADVLNLKIYIPCGPERLTNAQACSFHTPRSTRHTHHASILGLRGASSKHAFWLVLGRRNGSKRHEATHGASVKIQPRGHVSTHIKPPQPTGMASSNCLIRAGSASAFAMSLGQWPSSMSGSRCGKNAPLGVG